MGKALTTGAYPRRGRVLDGDVPQWPMSALISAMCVFALGVRALLISVFCCFGPFCGRGRPQDLVERVGFEISCRNQGSLPSGIGSEAIFGGGGPPRGSFLCQTKKQFLCSPAVPEINIDVCGKALSEIVWGLRF